MGTLPLYLLLIIRSSPFASSLQGSGARRFHDRSGRSHPMVAVRPQSERYWTGAATWSEGEFDQARARRVS